MVALAVVALICGTVLVIGHRTERALSAKWTAERNDAGFAGRRNAAIEERRVGVSEREVTLKELLFAKQSEKPAAPLLMPTDLVARVESWGTDIDAGEDPFAQENERQVILALYGEYGDWDKVRAHLAPREFSQ